MRIALVALAAWAGAAAEKPATRATIQKDAVLLAPADAQWTDVPDSGGIRQAVLWGDPATRGYGAFNKWPAGLDVPLHWHTFDHRVVVLSGVLALTLEGQPTREFPAGSYLMVPGRARHAASCGAGAECVFFSEQNLRYDIKMVETPPR
jgi:hypothetical protein